MPVNSTQVANVVLSDTFTIFASKTNELISIVNGLPATGDIGIGRTGGTIDGGVGGPILQGGAGHLFIINRLGLAIGDYLGDGELTVPTGDISIFQSDVSASINVVSTLSGGTANLSLQGTGNSAIRFLESSTVGMIIGYDDFGDKLDIRQLTGGTETDRFTFTQAGNFGIGTSSPAAAFHVVTSEAVGGITLVGDAEGDGVIKRARYGVQHYSNATEDPFIWAFVTTQSGLNHLNLGGGTSYGNAATKILFMTASNSTTPTGSERMRIDGDGSVGIGTDGDNSGTPKNKFEVLTGTTTNDMRIGFAEDADRKQSIIFSEHSSSWNPFFSIQHDGSGDHPLNLLKIRAASGSAGTLDKDVMTFMQSGKVGIGTNAPQELLHVVNSAGDAGVEIEAGDQGDAYLRLSENGSYGFEFRYDGSGSATDKLLIGSGQAASYINRLTIIRDNPTRVGIGTDDPTYTLDVAGNIGLGDGAGEDYLYHNGDNDTYLRFNQDKIIFVAGGIEFLRMHEDGIQEVISLGLASTDVDTAIYWNHATPALFVEGSTGEVGIGTITPKVPFHVYTTGTNATLADGTGTFLLGPEDGYNLIFDANEIQARNNAATGALHLQKSGGVLYVGNPTGELTSLASFMASTSRVGINKDIPERTLDVVGTFQATGITELASTQGASSTITGALQVAGGVGIVENLHVGGTLGVTGATSLSSLTIAGNEALDVDSDLIEMQNIFIDIPVAVGTRTYVLDAKARYPYKIDTVWSKCTSGSGTFTLRIDGIAVHGLTGAIIDTTGGDDPATLLATRTVAIDERVTLDFPDVAVTSAIENAEMSIQFTRTTLAAS